MPGYVSSNNKSSTGHSKALKRPRSSTSSSTNHYRPDLPSPTKRAHTADHRDGASTRDGVSLLAVLKNYWIERIYPRPPLAPTLRGTSASPDRPRHILMNGDSSHASTSQLRTDAVPNGSSSTATKPIYPSLPPPSSSLAPKSFSKKLSFPRSLQPAFKTQPKPVVDPALEAYETARQDWKFACQVAKARGDQEPEKPEIVKRGYRPNSSGRSSLNANGNARGVEMAKSSPSRSSSITPGWKKKRPMGASKHSETIHKNRSETVHGLATMASIKQEDDSYDAYRQRLEAMNENMEVGHVDKSKSKHVNATGMNRKGSLKYARNDVDSVLSKAKATMATPRPESRTFNYDDYRETQRQLELLSVKAPRQRLFPKKLSEEDQREVSQIYGNSNFKSTITGGEVLHKDVIRLKGLTWLNDETITFYATLINARSALYHDPTAKTHPPQSDEPGERILNVHCFMSFFYSTFTERGFAGVKRWTKKFDVFAKDRIIIPVNQGNSHWVCAAINLRQKRFEFFDSMGYVNKTVYSNLRKWLQEEHKAKKGGKEIDLSDWEDYWDEDVPLQNNGADCGVFTCMFMESLSRDVDHFDFSQKNMPYFRGKITLEMARKELIKEKWGNED